MYRIGCALGAGSTLIAAAVALGAVTGVVLVVRGEL